MYEMRVKADSERFARALVAAGCACEPWEDRLMVRVPPQGTEKIFWETAAASGLQIRYLRPRRSTLEEVFQKALVGED
jgi:ABC-2 type transport system ATP-binding protein